MATYKELRDLFSHDALRNKVEVACVVAAEAIRAEDAGTPNHANRLIWARRAFQNPATIRDTMLMTLLAANKDAAVEIIASATDAVIQGRVDAAVDLFADGS